MSRPILPASLPTGRRDTWCAWMGCHAPVSMRGRDRGWCVVHAEKALRAGAWPGCGCPPPHCPDCRVYALSGKKVCIVGDRDASGTVDAESYCALFDAQLMIARLEAGAFSHGTGRRRLLSVGVRWDGALNLLPSGDWNMADAQAAAKRLRPELLRAFHCVVLLGREVARAFAVGLGPFERNAQYLVLPAMSGRGREWERPSARDQARRTFREFVESKP